MSYKYRVDIPTLANLWDCIESADCENEHLTIKRIIIRQEFPKNLAFELDLGYSSFDPRYHYASGDDTFLVTLKDFSQEIRHKQRLQRMIDKFEEENVAIKSE